MSATQSKTRGEFPYIYFLRMDKSTVVGHNPHIVVINRHTPWVFQAWIDEIHQNPTAIVRVDNLITLVTWLKQGASSYLVISIRRPALRISDGPRSLQYAAMGIHSVSFDLK